MTAETVFSTLPARRELGEPVVVIRHLSKSYQLKGSNSKTDSQQHETTTTALHEIHLSTDSEFQAIRRGEFVILRGPSGGGKTSLLNILGAIDTASSGQVEILNDVIDEQSSDEFLSDLRLRKIGKPKTVLMHLPINQSGLLCTGFVFQTFNLLSNLSAVENVELPMTILGKLSASQRRQRAMDLLKMVGLQDRLSHLPSELSGGEQQRVTIARALANDPEILLLDEPTGDLDTFNTVEIMNLLMKINRERGTTCIMVTHNPDIECYADRLLYLKDGRLEWQAINLVPSALDYHQYSEYLKQRDGGE